MEFGRHVNKAWLGPVHKEYNPTAATQLDEQCVARHWADDVETTRHAVGDRVAVWRDVLDADGDHVTAAQFAVDRQIEKPPESAYGLRLKAWF